MNLTKNFTLEEFLRSDTAAKEGIKNEPNVAQTLNLKALAENTLQPIRDKWGKAMIINSGFRSEELNKAVGGVPTSQHTKGEAADIIINGNIFDLVLFIRDPKNDFIYDQLIYYPRKNFLHISYTRDKANRMQYLVK